MASFRDNFSDEHNSTANFTMVSSADIETQIDFFELRMERNGKPSAKFGPRKQEADQAYVSFAAEGIELGSRRDISLQQRWLDCVIQHKQVAPFGGQKNGLAARHGCLSMP